MKVINDPSFENHYIQVDDYNYSVYEEKTSEKKNTYPNLVGHYPNMALALTAMAGNMAKKSLNIESYITRLEKINHDFKNLTIKQ